MTTPLWDSVGLGSHELVSIVGAGGKTTILHTLGREVAANDSTVILTTTTRMARNQVTDPVCWSDDVDEVDFALVSGTPLFVLSGHDAEKVRGLEPEDVDRLFALTCVDHVIVEADGARTMSIKAPGDHEPVIPATSTTVIVVMGADAFGQPFDAVAHRVERISALIGVTARDTVTPERVAGILLHPEGGLRGVPDTSRVVTAITKVGRSNAIAVAELRDTLVDDPRIDRCVLLRQPLG